MLGLCTVTLAVTLPCPPLHPTTQPFPRPALLPTPQEAREEKITLQKEEHERRVKKALERAAAPVFRKVGKPVMTRSQLVRKVKVVKEDRRNEEEIELELFLARDML